MKPSISLVILLTLIVLAPDQLKAQVSPKVVEKRYQEYLDSIQEVDYAYVFPLLGDEARKRGVDLQKPGGIMLGYLWQDQNLSLSNLSVSLSNEGDMADIDDLTEFEYISTQNSVYTFRPDFWVLPFLNLYGQVSVFNAVTNAKLLVPLELEIPTVDKNGYGGGFGGVLAYGWGPVWATANFNMAWTTTPGLDKPTQSFVNSIRVGTSFATKKRKRSGSVWVGANYQNYLGSNSGSYDMSQLLPDEKPRLEEMLQQLEEFREEIGGRYEEFCSKPGNIAQCLIMDQIIDEFKGRIEDKISGITPPELVINYAYKVSPERNWNLVTGIQLNINKSWQARFEAGLIGRRSYMFNLNYRFGLIRKKTI
jgi:hypothetical protein